ncbi:MAG TPA: hypothetical protein VGQ78_03645 [Vicinamibacteria bacterium]|nr:hypothetical protein [Vicinamibacteria bacterium]
MKKVKVAFCLVLVCALAAGASAATKKAASHTAHKAMAAMSVTGCLKGSGDSFTLTPVSTAAKAKTMAASTPKPDWTITGATPDMKLSEHVGHKVRVTGTKEADNTLKIKSMKHIAATCP